MAGKYFKRGKVDPKILAPEIRRDYLDLFWTSVAALQTRDEVKNFFKDLLSESETIMLSRRITVAKELLEGANYEEISHKHNIGYATIGRVQYWLTSGFGGYDKALERFEKRLYQRQRKREKMLDRREAGPFGSLKQKYPLHFLLFNLFDEVESRRKFRKKNAKMIKTIKMARRGRSRLDR